MIPIIVNPLPLFPIPPKLRTLNFIFMNLHSGFMLPIDWFSMDFPGGSDGKNLPVLQKTQVWSLGREDSLGEGNGYPLQYSCLKNPMDRGAWWATIHGVAKSQTWLKWLSMHTRSPLGSDHFNPFLCFHSPRGGGCRYSLSCFATP